jgi:hypothetical protein
VSLLVWYSQACWYFRPLLWTSTPSNLLTGWPPPPVLISTGVCIYAVCNREGGGMGSGCAESIYI